MKHLYPPSICVIKIILAKVLQGKLGLLMKIGGGLTICFSNSDYIYVVNWILNKLPIT